MTESLSIPIQNGTEMTEPVSIPLGALEGLVDPEKYHEEDKAQEDKWEDLATAEEAKPELRQPQPAAREQASTEERPAWHEDYEAMERSERFAEESRAHKGAQIQQAFGAAQQAQAQLQANFQAVPPQQWERLRAENPQAFNQIMTDYQAQQNAHAQQLATLQAHAQELARENLNAEKEKVLRAKPEWRDSQAFMAAREEMLDYGRKNGFTEAELSNITDHRQLLALYHASQAGKPQKKAPGVRLKKAATPTRNDPLSRARERLARNPRDQDAEAAVFELLAS